MRVIERIHEESDCGNINHFEVEQVTDSGDQIAIVSFSCQEDCPEDNNIERNFNDIFQIKELIKNAYEAGKNGEDLTFSAEEVNW